jgi:hypothetical protein
MKTIKAFLLTDEARAAAEYSGNSQLSDFSPDDDGRVARHFNGEYTVLEVKALLEDLERVQAAYDKWSAGDIRIVRQSYVSPTVYRGRQIAVEHVRWELYVGAHYISTFSKRRYALIAASAAKAVRS